ncbi:CcmD family protein [Arcticibacter tournemirensis]|uniref:CcmD family protein n=1 Tax=Arcticibacter tournemirensis TaxID=699437 RepID=A0A4Q0MB87_9SPHI|nr:CcmD family protein [Arcticibacter tournemirensis]KAA8485009.1 CcmD family protein [Arcticibacter tournemirensis]RXF70414.1 CcmD family protein [Arcticibacter tournemirensis]TQM50537.1 CcmD family protein [Arcticibacter tournemirensis]
MKRIVFTALMLLISAVSVWAQPVEMADTLRGSGKIYVVVAVLAVIFIALIVYLFTIDSRLRKIEKRN